MCGICTHVHTRAHTHTHTHTHTSLTGSHSCKYNIVIHAEYHKFTNSSISTKHKRILSLFQVFDYCAVYTRRHNVFQLATCPVFSSCINLCSMFACSCTCTYSCTRGSAGIFLWWFPDVCFAKTDFSYHIVYTTLLWNYMHHECVYIIGGLHIVAPKWKLIIIFFPPLSTLWLSQELRMEMSVGESVWKSVCVCGGGGGEGGECVCMCVCVGGFGSW